MLKLEIIEGPRSCEQIKKRTVKLSVFLMRTYCYFSWSRLMLNTFEWACCGAS